MCCVLSCFSHVRLFAILWTTAHQAPLSKGFSRQEYWSGLPFPSSGDLPDPGIKPTSLCLLHWQVDPLPLTPPGKAPQNLQLSFKKYLFSHDNIQFKIFSFINLFFFVYAGSSLLCVGYSLVRCTDFLLQWLLLL